MRRTDPQLRRLHAVEDYPLVDGQGRRDTFRGLPQSPPWNALVFALRSPTFRFRDMLRLNGIAAAPLVSVSVPDIYERLDDRDAGTFLDQIKLSRAARHLAFEVSPAASSPVRSGLSAAELAAMFHIYFLGSSEGWSSMWRSRTSTPRCGTRWGLPDRMRRPVHTGVSVSSIESGGPKRLRVHADDGRSIDADGVVLAADVAGLQGIVAASTGLGDESWRQRVAAMEVAPPFVGNAWLDAPVEPDRPAFLGTGGLEPVDNISVVSSYEREAADWARAQGGSVVEVHSYSVPADAPLEGLRERMLARLHQLYPETARAGIVAERMLYKQDCPLFSRDPSPADPPSRRRSTA